ncbi:hypothetical protein ECG_00279 [Echinococcus granulosus]|nr:hypothetical protein ECG_00279 [Echinococcus granulosus]
MDAAYCSWEQEQKAVLQNTSGPRRISHPHQHALQPPQRRIFSHKNVIKSTKKSTCSHANHFSRRFYWFCVLLTSITCITTYRYY